MSNGSYQEIKDLIASLSQQVQRFREEANQAERALQAARTTLAYLEKGVSADAETDAGRYLRGFDGLTQLACLIKIAQDNGTNRFRVADAKKILLAAGRIKTAKNANPIIYTLIQRSERFRRIAPGEYELIPDSVRESTVTSIVKRAAG
jgi:hypothetical protein